MLEAVCREDMKWFYTSITYGGMSGGAVLDKEGRVIGIHGLAEVQTTIDSQGSTGKEIQLGYSLGIPVTTFIGFADRFEIESSLPIEEERPPELSSTELGAFEETIQNIEIPKSNATAENWLERGNQLWRLKRYQEAIDAINRAIAIDPEFYLAYYARGKALSSQEKSEAAIASYTKALEIEPKF